MPASAVFEFASPRMAADGVHYGDLARLERSVDRWADWFDAWARMADEYERLGDEATAAGNLRTAGDAYWDAALRWHYAHFLWYHEPELHAAAGRRKVALHRRAAPNLGPAAERVEVPFEDAPIPGYLRLPPNADRPPCVLLIGGLESTKEESRRFEETCLARGMATFTFDGPGQGEYLERRHLVPDFERYTSAILDYLETRPEIDADRLGILGRSLGGHYAVRAASTDDRLRACVAWGVIFDMRDFSGMRDLTQDGFRFITGLADPDAAEARVREYIDLSDVAGRLRAPLYMLHGALDALIPVSQVGLLDSATPSAEKVVDIVPDGDHCVHNMSHRVRPRMADWLAHRLGASAGS
jgi:2,6-dihydroxypseudooxynicotine hydrolase